MAESRSKQVFAYWAPITLPAPAEISWRPNSVKTHAVRSPAGENGLRASRPSVLLADSQQHTDRSPEGESSRNQQKAMHSLHFLPRNNLGKIQRFDFLRVESRHRARSDSQPGRA